MTTTKTVLYGGRAAVVRPAAGINGVLIRLAGGDYAFRIYRSDGEFTDYALRHDDLPVTIDPGALASFYERADEGFLDHSPEVLGLCEA
jgi:hypothetical protein